MLAILLSALITGHVLTDSGSPVAGVAVSDGVTIAQTDAAGVYELPYRDNAEFVFVSVPSGYDIPLDDTGSPLMYKRVSEAGTYDFTLHPQADGGAADMNHVLFVFSDPQVLNGYDDHRFRYETVEDVLEFKKNYPAGTKFYGLCVGDIVWDWYNANSMMKGYFEAMGFPSFMTIGNHDHNCQAATQETQAQQDSIADDKFTATWGPTYYSFNIGAIHYVVLDNVLYKGSKGSKDYSCGLTTEQQSWLQQDLALVPNGTPIVVSFHIPTRSMTGILTSLKSWMNKGAVVQHLLSGHTHTNIVNEVSARLIERTMGAAEGAFWCSNWCSDGSPNGYMVYEANGQKGFSNWFYKATGYPKEYQIRTFPVNSIDAGNGKTNCVLADVWSYDSKSQVNIYENGVKHVMRQFTGIDPKIYDVMLDEGDTRPNYPGSDGGTIASKNPGAGATNHMFYYEPEDPNADFVVEFIDRFGQVYTEPVLKNMMVASFTQNANGIWQYTEDFDELVEYPNQHSETLAKGTFVQGHYPEGWYACSSGTTLPDGISTPKWGTFNYFRIGEGSHTGSGLYNFGAGNPAVKSKNSTYRSLGSLNDASNRSIMYGVLIENNTGQKITSLDVAYTGKVWRVGTSATAIDTLKFEYVVLTSQTLLRQLRDRQKYLGDVRARALTDLDFVTPSAMTATTDGSVASKIDGDNNANQTHLSATLPVTVNPGEVVLLRWTDVDEQGEDQALAIDDLVVTATIEGQGIESIPKSAVNYQKILRNGQVVIIKNNTEYTILGNRL
ncbi:MAG: calcineurin-like phosphoesterase C-terminal domain-containing protein [Paludibacteraceae bacterium]|nr:calcineurin-like phosphoesterase C-terminal domain-containing protein [Paludibacteraceae bacterium]